MPIIQNKFVQCLGVMFVVAFIKVVASGLLGVPAYPERSLSILHDQRDWAGIAYYLIYDVGELIKGAFLLRAVGLIEFIK